MGLAPTDVWRVSPPVPHCNWRTLPSSQSPSLPALSLSLPPTPLGSFCNAPGVRDGAAQSGGARGPRGGWRGRALQRYLGPDPHLGVLDDSIFTQRQRHLRSCSRKGVTTGCKEARTKYYINMKRQFVHKILVHNFRAT